MISRNDYDSFGEIVSSTGLTQNAVTYTGQRLDSESGLMPLGNGERYYNPSYGRFIQQDSFAGFPQEPQSLNRFSYVINNPTKHTDPSGHIAPLVVLAVIGVGALIGGGVGAGYSYTKQQAEIADGTRKAADFSYTEIAKSAGLGALFGGAAAGIATVGTLAAAAVIGGGAVMSGVQLYQGYVDYQNGNEYSGKTDMAFGVAGVLLSFLGAKSLAGRSNTRVIQENVNKTTPRQQELPFGKPIRNTPKQQELPFEKSVRIPKAKTKTTTEKQVTKLGKDSRQRTFEFESEQPTLKPKFNEKWNEYLTDVENQTNVRIGTKQREALVREVYENNPTRLSKDQIIDRRGEFSKVKNKLIKRWEKETGQNWGKYQADVPSRNGIRLFRKRGDKFDAHELIENSYGSPHKWWNIHPARSPDQHQGGIHRRGSLARELFSEE